MALNRHSVDGLERLDRDSISSPADRKSLLSALLTLDEVDEAINDEGGDFGGERLSNPSGHSEGSLHTKLLDSLDDQSTQGPVSKFFYKLFGLTWHDKVFQRKLPLGPQMYNFHNIGLYTHYAGVGLSGGIVGLCSNFCFYFYEGSNNVCANATSLIFIAWGFKIFYAMATDSFRPGTNLVFLLKLFTLHTTFYLLLF